MCGPGFQTTHHSISKVSQLNAHSFSHSFYYLTTLHSSSGRTAPEALACAANCLCVASRWISKRSGMVWTMDHQSDGMDLVVAVAPYCVAKSVLSLCRGAWRGMPLQHGPWAPARRG